MSAEFISENVVTDALVAIHSRIPEAALTAGLLGQERTGHGIRIRADGLIATVGYLVLEAEQIWVTSSGGKGSPGYLVANDYDSGIALLKTTMPVGEGHLVPGSVDHLSVGDPVNVLRFGLKGQACEIIAKEEFAGRWEYLLDEAVFTAPACNDWAGAALVNHMGQLCGIGSLLMDIPYGSEAATLGNMFIPMDLVAPYLDEMCTYGQRNKPSRPWMGMLIQEYEGKLLVVGVYRDCPADRAGIKPGEFILCVDNEPVNSLPEMFRKVWGLGSAGVDVPLTVSGTDELRYCNLHSVDRSVFHQRSVAGTIN